MTTSLKIKFSHFIIFIMALPFLSILICVFLAMWLHFEDATYTHCKVNNYLPSISAAVSRYPEAYLWRFGIGLHSLPRYLLAAMYLKFYQEALNPRSKMNFIVKLNTALNISEITCLLLLTYISSTENYDAHKYSFIGFLSCSMMYMTLTCYLFGQLGNTKYNVKNSQSMKLKYIYFISTIVFFLLAMYFFWRHNTYCEAGVYSLFGLFEYLVVLMNILFHGSAVYDFSDTVIEVPIRHITDTDGKRWNV